MYTILENIKTIVNIIKPGTNQLKCADREGIFITKADPGSSLSLIVNEKGYIEDIIAGKFNLTLLNNHYNIINCKEGCIIPGFVDSHTYPVWAGDHIDDTITRMEGNMPIRKEEHGQNVHLVVKNTTGIIEDELYELLKERLRSMMKKGTTTVECKSGYGLLWKDEFKLLRVLNKAKRELPIGISITMLLAHALPKYVIQYSTMNSGYDSECFAETIINEHIPELSRHISDKSIHVDNIDICYERYMEKCEQILVEAKKMGINLNFHADEFSNNKGAELAGRLKAKAASHLEEASPSGIIEMAKSGTTAVLLPLTYQRLDKRPPPVKSILQAGVPIALGTDFNPYSYCLSMPLVMFSACTNLNMTPEEALIASTINSANSLGLSHQIGAITPGRQADLIVLNCSRWENIIYQVGEAESLIKYVIIKGHVVYDQETGFIDF